jgi:hypothetical protein
MSLTSLLADLVLVGAGAYGLWHRRHWLFFLAVAGGVFGLAMSLDWYFATGGIWWLAVSDLVSAPIAVVMALIVLLPRLRNRMSDSDGRFDRDLYACLGELGHIFDGRPTGQDREVIASWITQAYERCLRVLHNLERLEAPSRDWNGLLGAYIELTRKTAAVIYSGVTPDQNRLLDAEGDALATRYEGMRPYFPRRRGAR